MMGRTKTRPPARPRYEQLSRWVEVARVDGITYILIDGKELTHIDTKYEDLILTFLVAKK